MSSGFVWSLVAAAGVFTLGLGVVHLWIPRIFAFDRAIGTDGDPADPGLGHIATGPWRYQRRRRDALGLSWVMSNAASYVLITIGLLDLAWVAGWRGIPVALGAAWIAVWWAIRAGSQLTIGRRRLDWSVAAWFAVLGVIHVALAMTTAAT